MKKKQSTRRGATIERSVVLRKITRLKKQFGTGVSAHLALNELESWIKTRVPRFKKRKGGL